MATHHGRDDTRFPDHDSGYGDAAEFRHGHAERGLAYAVQVTGGNLSGYPLETIRTTPEYGGVGKHPEPRYRDRHRVWLNWSPLSDRGMARRVSWRQGSR